MSAKIKAYSKKELAALYGVSERTLRNWLKPFQSKIGKQIGIYFNPKQVRLIFENLGEPM